MDSNRDQRARTRAAYASRLSAIKTAPRWIVPRPVSAAELTMADGAVVRLRRHGNPLGPRLAMSHGNGLAINAYLPFWSLLLDRFDVVLFDARNHGENPLHRQRGHDWPSIVRDHVEIFAGIARHFGAKPVAGVFHSLMAVAAIAATLDHGPLWTPLVLIDPPLFPPDGHELQDMERRHMIEMATLARRRVDAYESPESFASQLASREFFARWVAGAHLLFAAATLRHEAARDIWQLRCPKDMEAFIFETNMDAGLWPRMTRCPVPVYLLGSDPTPAYAQQAPAKLTAALAREFDLPYRMVRDTTHMVQIEQPLEAAEIVASFLERSGIRAG